MNSRDTYKQVRKDIEPQVHTLREAALEHLHQARDRASDYADTAKTYADAAGKELTVAKKTLSKKVSNDPLSALLLAGMAGFALAFFTRK
ncbi:MAG: hypothetical protein PW788_07635 [Micavibrio sp.]|nr:hypothetical protein [Micavibrio sp.]